MRSYDDARKLIGQKMEASTTNGRTRWIKFEENTDGSVAVVMFHTEIVTFYPEHLDVQTEGFVTPSTFDGIATALGVSRICVGTVKREPFLFGHRMSEGMRLDYAGAVISGGRELTPMTLPRKRTSA